MEKQKLLTELYFDLERIEDALEFFMEDFTGTTSQSQDGALNSAITEIAKVQSKLIKAGALEKEASHD